MCGQLAVCAMLRELVLASVKNRRCSLLFFLLCALLFRGVIVAMFECQIGPGARGVCACGRAGDSWRGMVVERT